MCLAAASLKGRRKAKDISSSRRATRDICSIRNPKAILSSPKATRSSRKAIRSRRATRRTQRPSRSSRRRSLRRTAPCNGSTATRARPPAPMGTWTRRRSSRQSPRPNRRRLRVYARPFLRPLMVLLDCKGRRSQRSRAWMPSPPHPHPRARSPARSPPARNCRRRSRRPLRPVRLGRRGASFCLLRRRCPHLHLHLLLHQRQRRGINCASARRPRHLVGHRNSGARVQVGDPRRGGRRALRL